MVATRIAAKLAGRMVAVVRLSGAPDRGEVLRWAVALNGVTVKRWKEGQFGYDITTMSEVIVTGVERDKGSREILRLSVRRAGDVDSPVWQTPPRYVLPLAGEKL